MINHAVTAPLFWDGSPGHLKKVTLHKVAVTSISDWNQQMVVTWNDNMMNKGATTSHLVTLHKEMITVEPSNYGHLSDTNKSDTTNHVVILQKAVVIVETSNSDRLRVIMWRTKSAWIKLLSDSSQISSHSDLILDSLNHCHINVAIWQRGGILVTNVIMTVVTSHRLAVILGYVTETDAATYFI